MYGKNEFYVYFIVHQQQKREKDIYATRMISRQDVATKRWVHAGNNMAFLGLSTSS